MSDGDKMEVMQMKKTIRETAILNQIASLLADEALINPDEQIRFLALLREEK